MDEDAGISHRGTEVTEIECQDSGRKKIKVNLSVPCVFVVQGFFTAKAQGTRRVFLLVLSRSWRKDSGSGRNQALPGGYRLLWNL